MSRNIGRLPGPTILPGRWLRFLVTGCINTAVDFAVFAALYLWAGFGPFPANLGAFAAGVTCSYILNSLWTFGDRGRASPLAFVLWMAAIALSASWLLDRLVAGGLHVVLAKIGVTALIMVASYLVMSRIIFSSQSPVHDRQRRGLIGGLTAFAGAIGLNLALPPGRVASGLPKDLADLYDGSLSPVTGPLNIFHLGHSLVGRDMPAMLAQLAGPGHIHTSQLGWGTSINAHLAGQSRINGFDTENAHPAYRPLDTALADPATDALIFTEMINLRDAIRWEDTENAVTRLVTMARGQNPDLRILLYETWHPLYQGDWLADIDRDRDTLWLPHLLAPAIRAAGGPVGLIPAGTVMARLVARVEETPGGIGGMTRREDLFARNGDGSQDEIHLNDLGHYLVALVHYAVLYHRSPPGLPHALTRADGSAAEAPSEELAAAMQALVWEVVQADPLAR